MGPYQKTYALAPKVASVFCEGLRVSHGRECETGVNLSKTAGWTGDEHNLARLFYQKFRLVSSQWCAVILRTGVACEPHCGHGPGAIGCWTVPSNPHCPHR